MNQEPKPLFILELANNHNGNLERGKKLIKELKKKVEGYKKYFDFAIKLQYRNLDTFIHPEYKNSKSVKSIKRFGEVKLSNTEFLELREEIEKQGFISVCTAFDEDSVDLIEKQNYDYIKIASCSFCDWPLLEKIASKNIPIIASTAGVDIENIDKVVNYFLSKGKNISLMHCVAEYPTQVKNLELNQIDLLKNRYPNLTIGYSTHENPDNTDTIKMAIAKGAKIFEKHVGLADYKNSINKYSATPEQIVKWLESAKIAYESCGIENERYNSTLDELKSLKNLTRGAFAAKEIQKGQIIKRSDVFFAIPTIKSQIIPSDITFNSEFYAAKDIRKNSPILFSDVKIENLSNIVLI